MTSVQMKGINDHLLFKFNDEVGDDVCFSDLEKILSSPSFHRDDCYVKGYFDFGKKPWTEERLMQLLAVLKQSKSVLFCGINCAAEPPSTLKHLHGIVRNGETLEVNEDLLFEGKVNPGGRLVVHGCLYLLGCGQGIIEVSGKQASINATDLKHAKIIINHHYRQDVSVSQLTVFYDDGNRIGCRKEGDHQWQEQL